MSVARGRFYTKNEEEMSNSNFIIKVTVANILEQTRVTIIINYQITK